MRKIFLLATACILGFSPSLMAQTRRIRGGTDRITFYVDGKSVPEHEIASDFSGQIEAFYAQKKIMASFKNGELLGPFKTSDITGIVKDTGEFAYKDSQDNWGQGSLRCSGMETFKSFVQFLSNSNGSRSSFYKCVTLKRASADMFFGILNVEGGISFPSLTENTVVTFSPNLNLLPSPVVRQFLPKDIRFDLDKEGQKVDTHLIFDDKNEVLLGLDFKESFLIQANRVQSLGSKALKDTEEVSNVVIRKINVPTYSGKDGLIFNGGFNVKDGIASQSNFSLFAPNEKKVVDLKIENGTLHSLIKYPATDMPFVSGEVFKKNVADSYNAVLAFLLMSSQAPENAAGWSDKMPEILSGLELKNFTIYGQQNQKLSEFNIKFKDVITLDDINRVKTNPQEMDNFVSGRVTLYQPGEQPLNIEFNETNFVKVNGVENNQENVADFFGILKIHSTLVGKHLEAYLEQMDPVMKNLVLLGPVYAYFDMENKANRVLERAEQYAHTTYEKCAQDLENEKIDFMDSCVGLDFAAVKDLKPIKGVQMKLEKDVHSDSFIIYDPKAGRDTIAIRISFENKDLCETVAKKKRSKCINNEALVQMKTELKTY